MRMTGLRPEVGARLIIFPLSANFPCNFLHFEGPVYRFYHCMAIFGALFLEKDEV